MNRDVRVDVDLVAVQEGGITIRMSNKKEEDEERLKKESKRRREERRGDCNIRYLILSSWDVTK